MKLNKRELKQQNILRFWRDVEIFNLPDFNKNADLFQEGDLLPWLRKDNSIQKNYKWRYTLLFGKVEKKIIIEHLNKLLDSNPKNDWEEPIVGFSCMSALILNEDGNPSPDSYIASSYMFGIKALEDNKNLTSVSESLKDINSNYLQRYNFTSIEPESKEPAEGESVTWEHLKREISYLKQLNSWLKTDVQIYIYSELVPKDSEPNTSFLNSFYLDDLNYLSSSSPKQYGQALKQYLNILPNESARKDLIKHKDLLFETFNPKLMTAARWPSNPEYGLYTAQAGAVNEIFSGLRTNEGVQGVNGPPGTGKTTLLLDVIAEVILDRANVLSVLGCDKMFELGSSKIIKENGYTQHTYTLNSSLRNNYGVVVASNNNAAVENISKELPLKTKIDSSAFPEAEYFSECSQLLIDEESWGILAAALGNFKNRDKFKKAFWKSDKKVDFIGFHDLLYNIYKDTEEDKTKHHESEFNLKSTLLKSLMKQFEVYKNTASSFHEQLPEYLSNKAKEEGLKKQLKEIEHNFNSLLNEDDRLNTKETSVKNEIDSIQSVLNLHMQIKPSFFFFQKLFSTQKYKLWNSEAEQIVNKFNVLSLKLSEIQGSISANADKISVLNVEKDKCNTSLSSLIPFFDRYRKIKNILKTEYEIDEKNLYDILFYNRSMEEIHLLNPYHSPKIARLRSNIFITALQLHKHAILANAKNIRNNLLLFFEMISGWAKVESSLAQNLWDTFFLCVPVVSTTLASASRLFPNTTRNQIGWLLIDEAGQATPQSAAGLIHRSKRCVIVGDPLQVEPVVTIPERIISQLREEHNVEVNWSPYITSVQKLADRISTFGTYMNIGDSDEKIWTGFPLRTHRRCDNPMFSIANEIAYSNQMVKAVKQNSREKYIGESDWFHVECFSTPYNKHVIQEEINLLESKINDLLQSGYTGTIYVISPFKSIANFCNDKFKNYKQIDCGTIHKFQGKEADIVFLVLGSNPNSPNARAWASEKPNMLNVALTRAKKRIYVIGNRELWAKCDYFKSMDRVFANT